MTSLFTSALALTILLLLSSPAVAQTATAEPKPETTEELKPKTAEAAEPETPLPSFFSETTVTATGSKRDVFEVATPVTVVRREQIERKAPQNAADLLRDEPGVDVAGVGPNQMRPVIRASTCLG